ncbi:transcriptional regulator, TetR family [Amycolatopsis marina]|uniref:Transcriptional regulator, TetR family n=1 Tax=Amycolatopsis marina TaxID=490629 RepID=A0A1I0WVZ9_9PSEU|nr:TetR family transcriptional regulator C-terminal domain-containing protein [Amycolatopsis marina]SFA92093.1 transcriptional regulator, TetR family [Amycolatopsis marina]
MKDRRQQILDAATRIVAEGGMSALSVRAVAAAAGIGASTLRYYFPSQRELYDEVVGRSFDDQLSNLRIHDRAIPPAERLLECLLQFLPPSEDQVLHLERWLAFYTSAVGPDRTEQGAALLASFAHRARRRVDAWLAVLQQEDALRHGDRARHGTLLLALIDGLCLELLTPQSPATLESARTALADAIGNTVVLAEN